ncbi:phospho-N-acetylmuramoyl-pentapeptide-transferase [Alkalitalea saponilacus]|uniref:Phospho-N-acetylmuramoyl-pentapeptide-transferase n=1 Tax=Alkalitalea saponilacus TaxID=889453 RepID=A0A1T5HR12_9BACT|nr:phospho-N-acetylmuramoyl-pentapeptide-transferase [Alkalitalea saponilacus]ASB48397.1 phospho-N-acetylmuramoyl-pentapeptide-transferase [Alkalitalea saponilacus]SKC23108.1 Phospho-N-acetylmuramoyl-pentapeptide-transferase [Alkalitalea saponilacus]
MLFYLFEYLQSIDFPGAGMFQYISFRSGMAVIFSLLIGLFIGKWVIRKLQKQQIGEVVRDLGLEGQYQKIGTPTMGGVIIIVSILIPVLMFARLDNVYVLLMVVTTVWLGIIGFLDDYIKVFKKNKEGLAGRFKIIGQVGLGLIVGLTLYFNQDVVARIKTPVPDMYVESVEGEKVQKIKVETIKAPVTNVPFFKNNRINYTSLVEFLGDKAKAWGWVVFVLVVTFIITAVSNGANMTDGLDGLATGVSSIIGVTLGIFAYVSGHAIYADYLNIMFIPHSQELVVFMSAFIGACIGFLWYNSFPAQVFMGDTGSLTIGGIIAVFAILVRIELLIPILCGVFLVENLSVMIQVGYFKYTKRKYGEGRRVFKMAPLHHHYQMKGYTESKIVTRFWIVSIILAVLTIVTLKIR